LPFNLKPEITKFMRKYCLMGCVCIAGVLFYSKTEAQDSSSIKIKDTTIIKFTDTLTDKQKEEIQKSLDSLLKPAKSYFQAGISYLSNNVYMGRKDTVSIPYITATAGYYHKSGLYINTSASYLPNANPGRIDLFTIEGGYNFKAGKFEGQANADKFFYSSESNNVKAELKGSLSFFGSYDFGFIKPTITPALNIGNKLDFALTVGLEHTFYADNDALDITPAINANGSTQNYYNSYYKERKFRIKKNGVIVPKASISGAVDDAAAFKILDYEFTIPVNYTIKKFTFNFTPVYAVPVHPAMVTITTQVANLAPKIRTGAEKVSNSFFWQAGVTYKF
jgi:hypothetical protein